MRGWPVRAIPTANGIGKRGRSWSAQRAGAELTLSAPKALCGCQTPQASRKPSGYRAAESEKGSRRWVQAPQTPQTSAFQAWGRWFRGATGVHCTGRGDGQSADKCTETGYACVKKADSTGETCSWSIRGYSCERRIWIPWALSQQTIPNGVQALQEGRLPLVETNRSTRVFRTRQQGLFDPVVLDGDNRLRLGE